MCHRDPMDPLSQASWLSAIPAMAVVVALILPSGWFVARACGVEPIIALGVAPASGTFVLLLAASCASGLGLDWTPVSGIAALVIVTAALVGLGRLVRAGVDQTDAVSGGQLLALAGSVVLATTVMAWQFIAGTGAPDALAQMPDAPFHLLAVADLVEAHSASPWRSGEVLWYAPGSFYPGGFHSVAATAALWTGVDFDVASHATLLVFTAGFWPLSLILLAYAAVPRSAWIYLAAGVLTVATTFSALAMMPVGAAWANAASASLLPAMLIPLVLLSRAERRPTPRQLVATVGLVLAMTAAASLCQPNAVFGLALLGLPLLGPRLFSWGRGWAVAWCCAVAGAVAVWIVLFPQDALDTPVTGDPDLRRSLLLVLKGGELPMLAGAVVLLLTVIGLAYGLRRLGSAGLVLAWAVAFLVLLAVVFETGLEVQRVAWPWYSGTQRVTVVWAVPAFLVAVLGFAWVERSVRAIAPSLAVPVLALGLVVLGLAALPAVSQVRDDVRRGYYPSDPAFTYVTDGEVAALQQLSGDIAPDGAVALDPFRGGMYLGMFGRRTIPLVPFSTTTAQGELIDSSLDTASSDPRVCDAARDLGLTHVLTGGSRAKFWSALDPHAPGIDAVPGAEGFARVASAGPYVLYRIPAKCQA